MIFLVDKVLVTGSLLVLLFGFTYGINEASAEPLRPNLKFHHITINEGLSQPNVQVVFQDSEGFMWFGTENGLNRYDGYNIKVYRNDPGNPHSLNHNHIISLYEDTNGDFWIGTLGGGLHLYDRDRDRFQRIIGDPTDDSTLSDNSIWDIHEDHLGNFWIATSYGLNLMNRKDFTTEKFYYDPDDTTSISSFDIKAVLEDSRNNLWVGTENGLNLMNRKEGTFTRFKHDPEDPTSISSNRVRTIYEDHSGTLWIGTLGGGLNKFDYSGRNFESFTPDAEVNNSNWANMVYAILEDSEGLLWVGMGAHGLNIFDREREAFHSYRNDANHPLGYSITAVNSLFESRDGIVWIGSYATSVSYVDNAMRLFTNISPVERSRSEMNNNRVRAFQQDSDVNIWMGTDGGGLGLFDPEFDLIEVYRHDASHEQTIPSDAILALHKNNDGLWIGSYAGGLSVLDPDQNRFRHFRYDPDDPRSLSSNDVYTITEDRDANLWIGTNRGGLNLLQPGSDSFVRFMRDPEDPGSIPSNDVRSVYEDSRGRIWVGTYSGQLTEFDKEQNRFENYEINFGETYYSTVIQSFLEDSEQRFWLGTRGSGVIEFDRDEKSVVATYTVEDGLSGNLVQDMLEDDNGIIWLSTENGISRLNPSTGQIQNFDEYSGAMSGGYLPAAGFQDGDGNMYFGGENGFTRLHPQSIDLERQEHPVIFSELQISNQPVTVHDEGSPLQKQIHRTGEITLSHKEATSISLRYSALNFSPVKHNQFAYKMEGFDEDWNYVGSQRSATYTNLNPGKYVFRVRSTNNYGIWSESDARVALVITPPFWRTNWFLILASLFLGFAVFFIYRWRVYRLNARGKELERLVEQRTAELKEANTTKDKLFSIIAHDLNNVAFGLHGFIELLQDSAENEDLDEVKEFTRHLRQVYGNYNELLENLLNWARSQSDRVEHCPEKINLGKLVDEHINQLKLRAIDKDITLKTSVDPDIHVYADRNMLSVIFRNLLHNALKFSKDGGEVEVVATENGNIVEISVSDSGIGMTPDQIDNILSTDQMVTTVGTRNEKGTGLGLMLCKDFISRNGGELQIESKKGEGSRFAFQLPKYSG